jgi:hypothetical protein
MNTRDGAPPSPSSLTFPTDNSRSPSPEITTLHTPRPDSPEGASDIDQSPSASTFLRTAATLEGLAQQLSNLSNDAEDDTAGMGCCCGAIEEGRVCSMAKGRERIAEKLLLSGGTSNQEFLTTWLMISEIGNALLHRYEALEKKHAFEMKRLQTQVRA